MIKFRKARLGALWVAIFLLGLAGGYLGGNAFQAQALTGLANEAAERAASFAPGELSGLGAAAIRTDPAFAAVKARLARIQAVTPRARLVYLLRFRPATGRALFLVDSARAGAPARFAPGTEASGAAASVGLQRAVYSGQPATDGPNADPAGMVAVAYAPIRALDGERLGAPTNEVLGIEFNCSDWPERWWLRAGGDALLIWIVLGAPLGVLLVSRRHREQRGALRNLLTAMEQSSSAVMIVNLESRIEYANAGLCQQMGYARRELIGRSWRDFQQQETKPELIAELVANVRAGRPWSGEWFNRRKNGELFAVRGTITPIKNRQARITGFVAVFEDMTEIRRSESTLRTALDRAEAGDRTKSRFLATMSHEVRTPLNGIVGFTGLLLDTALTPEQAEYVQTIRTSGEALIQLTSDILDFARIESGSLKLELQPSNPRACVEDTLDLLAVQAADKGLELLHWTEEGVPAVVMVDDARLRQVLVNLINNAVKFTEKGVIEVSLSAELVKAAPEPDQPADWLLKFVVRDTGIGIAAEHGSMLFKPFRQVDESTTRRHGGTGLGLAISRNLVELMGGTIDFESMPGHGSAFTFTVPASAVAGMTRVAPELGRLRIGLVAPDGLFRDEFTRLAQRWGVPLAAAETIAAFPREGWDIAFVALDAELARQIVAGSALPLPREHTYALVPVSLPSDLRVALRAHFCQLINKPLHHDSLLSLLAGFRPAARAAKAPGKEFGLNVLAVEDNLVNQRLVQKLLHNLGCRATIAGNGRIALEDLARPEAAYDLVLMDLHMPELDGLGAIEKIRAGEAGEAVQKIWIAVLTADARAVQKERVMAAGANDYLVKPVSLTELAASLQLYLERR